MNISEVYMLRDNLWMFYAGISKPYLYTQRGNHRWYLRGDEIRESSYSYSTQALSESLFNGLFR